MKRRELLKASLALSATSVLSTPLKAIQPNIADNVKSASQKQSPLTINKLSFDNALKKHPKLIGFQGVASNFAEQSLTLEGKFPKDLNGNFYRNGAAQHEKGNERYLHLFEGDGMVHRFHMADGKISHHAKFINTPKYQKEQQAQKFLYSGPDSKIDNSLAVHSADTINTANTNVIAVNNELWALWEAGSPVALDQTSLETKGLINLGDNSRFGQQLKGLAFSAHPKIEANGDIWNFGLSASGQVVVYHMNAQGVMQNVNIVNANYKGAMLHDFLITDKHILLILPSLVKNRTKPGFFSAIDFDKNTPMRVLIVDKQSLKLKRQVELDAGFAFHYGNAWEDNDGTIRFDASLYPNIEILHHMNDIMRGQGDSINFSSSQKHLEAKTVLFQINTNNTSSKQVIEGASEFPRVYPNSTGLKNRYLYTLSSTQSNLWNDTVSCLDLDKGKKDSYQYGKEYLVEEHIIAGKNLKEGDGYLIGTALHVPSKRTCLNIFKANNLAEGPVCRAWLPYHIPLGFHGNFLAA